MRISYLLQRGKCYYFQFRVPVDIQAFFGCTHLKKSLKTESYRQASTLAKTLMAEVERASFMIRSGFLNPEMIGQIVTDIKEGILELHRKHGRKGPSKSEQLKVTAEKFKTQLKKRDYADVEQDALLHLKNRGINIAEINDADLATLYDGILQAKMRAFEVMAERDDGNLANGYDNGLIMKVKQRKERLSALMKDYIAMNKHSWGTRTLARKKGNFKKVSEVLGDAYTSEITKDLMQHLFKELKNYPPNRFKPPYGGLTLEQCRQLPKFTPMGAVTFHDTWVDVSALLKFGTECQSALNFDPPSASNFDPPQVVVFSC